MRKSQLSQNYFCTKLYLHVKIAAIRYLHYQALVVIFDEYHLHKF